MTGCPWGRSVGHKHDWRLGGPYYGVVGPDDEIYTNNAQWLCPCGAEKITPIWRIGK